ncbi:MAG: hypothetical protein RL177_684, partial [Bacteroidota bacterium]
MEDKCEVSLLISNPRFKPGARGGRLRMRVALYKIEEKLVPRSTVYGLRSTAHGLRS